MATHNCLPMADPSTAVTYVCKHHVLALQPRATGRPGLVSGACPLIAVG